MFSRYSLNALPLDAIVNSLVLQQVVLVLLGLLEGDVHVAVETGEQATIVDAGVQFDHNRLANDLLQEIARRSLLAVHLLDAIRLQDHSSGVRSINFNCKFQSSANSSSSSPAMWTVGSKI